MLAVNPQHDPYATLRVAQYRWLLLAFAAAQTGLGIKVVALGWDVYQRTGQAFGLAVLGLVQVIPAVLLFLPAGYVADRWPRKHISVVSSALVSLSTMVLAWASWSGAPTWLIYVLLACESAAVSFNKPARAALLAQAVPRHLFENSVAWRTGCVQTAAICGPALGGLILSASLPAAYLASAVLSMLYCLVLSGLSIGQTTPSASGAHTSGALKGVHFLMHHRVLGSAILLDLLTVMMGGALYLLPIYARDILAVGEQGLGWLRAAPAVGALCMAIFLAHRPPMRQAGRSMLLAVACYGAATTAFGFSTSFWCSLVLLFFVGAFDNVTMVVRHTMIQSLTPHHMWGRVSAVSLFAAGTANDLGGVESGLVAQWFGPMASVVTGGLGAVILAGCATLRMPWLRKVTALHVAESDADKTASPAANDSAFTRPVPSPPPAATCC